MTAIRFVHVLLAAVILAIFAMVSLIEVVDRVIREKESHERRREGSSIVGDDKMHADLSPSSSVAGSLSYLQRDTDEEK